MNKIAIGLALIALGAAAITAGRNASEHGTYRLIENYQTDSFVIDHGLTLGDCVEALPRNDVQHGITFACERAK
jgi:hypothetical protein